MLLPSFQHFGVKISCFSIQVIFNFLTNTTKRNLFTVGYTIWIMYQSKYSATQLTFRAYNLLILIKGQKFIYYFVKLSYREKKVEKYDISKFADWKSSHIIVSFIYWGEKKKLCSENCITVKLICSLWSKYNIVVVLNRNVFQEKRIKFSLYSWDARAVSFRNWIKTINSLFWLGILAI